MEKFGFHVGKTVQKGFAGCPFFRQPRWTFLLACERFGGPISWFAAIQTPNTNSVTSNFPLWSFWRGEKNLCINVPSKSAGEMPFPYDSLTITQQKWTNMLFTLAIPSTLKNEPRAWSIHWLCLDQGILQATRSKQRPSVSKVNGSNVMCLSVGSPPENCSRSSRSKVHSSPWWCHSLLAKLVNITPLTWF